MLNQWQQNHWYQNQYYETGKMASGSDLNSFYVLVFQCSLGGMREMLSLPQGWIATGESVCAALHAVWANKGRREQRHLCGHGLSAQGQLESHGACCSILDIGKNQMPGGECKHGKNMYTFLSVPFLPYIKLKESEMVLLDSPLFAIRAAWNSKKNTAVI